MSWTDPACPDCEEHPARAVRDVRTEAGMSACEWCPFMACSRCKWQGGQQVPPELELIAETTCQICGLICEDAVCEDCGQTSEMTRV